MRGVGTLIERLYLMSSKNTRICSRIWLLGHFHKSFSFNFFKPIKASLKYGRVRCKGLVFGYNNMEHISEHFEVNSLRHLANNYYHVEGMYLH